MVTQEEANKILQYTAVEGITDVKPELSDQLREINRAELFRYMAKPDLQDKIKMNFLRYQFEKKIIDGKPMISVMQVPEIISPFTKELKTSNLSQMQLDLVIELSDLAAYLNALGAPDMPRFLIMFRDTLLSASPSKDAMFLKLTQT